MNKCGGCGAICDSFFELFLLKQFSVFLAIIFVCELAGGIAAYVLRTDVDVVLNESMTKALQQYNVTGHDGVTHTWDVLQHEVCIFSQLFFLFYPILFIFNKN